MPNEISREFRAVVYVVVVVVVCVCVCVCLCVFVCVCGGVTRILNKTIMRKGHVKAFVGDVRRASKL
jgi:hypothetical protein